MLGPPAPPATVGATDALSHARATAVAIKKMAHPPAGRRAAELRRQDRRRAGSHDADVGRPHGGLRGRQRGAARGSRGHVGCRAGEPPRRRGRHRGARRRPARGRRGSNRHRARRRRATSAACGWARFAGSSRSSRSTRSARGGDWPMRSRAVAATFLPDTVKRPGFGCLDDRLRSHLRPCQRSLLVGSAASRRPPVRGADPGVSQREGRGLSVVAATRRFPTTRRRRSRDSPISRSTRTIACRRSSPRSRRIRR